MVKCKISKKYLRLKCKYKVNRYLKKNVDGIYVSKLTL